MSKISKLLSSLLVGVNTGMLDESWLPHINDAMNELRYLEATQHTLAPDAAYCGDCKRETASDEYGWCKECGQRR